MREGAASASHAGRGSWKAAPLGGALLGAAGGLLVVGVLVGMLGRAVPLALALSIVGWHVVLVSAFAFTAGALVGLARCIPPLGRSARFRAFAPSAALGSAAALWSAALLVRAGERGLVAWAVAGAFALAGALLASAVSRRRAWRRAGGFALALGGLVAAVSLASVVRIRRTDPFPTGHHQQVAPAGHGRPTPPAGHGHPTVPAGPGQTTAPVGPGSPGRAAHDAETPLTTAEPSLPAALPIPTGTQAGLAHREVVARAIVSETRRRRPWSETTRSAGARPSHARTDGSGREGAVQRSRPRNLVLIVVDTLRADHLSCYGYARKTSPAIDALASESVLFTRCMTQKTNTSPSVASLLTGTYPYRHGLVGCGQWLPDDVRTLAETLSDAGLRTASIVGNGNVGAVFNFDQGFDETFERRTGLADAAAVTLNAAAIPWLAKHRDRPFFLYVHYMDPHAPYRPPEPFRGRFEGDAEYGRFRALQVPVAREYIGSIHKSVLIDAGSTDLDLYIARYDEAIAYVDAEIGRLLAALATLGREKDTLVVLTADHGESLVEHGCYFNHGLDAFETTTHVPLIVRVPPAGGGWVVEDVVEIVDVMPTVLDLMGLPRSPPVDGSSLAPFVLDEPGEGAVLGSGEDRGRGGGIAFGEGGYRMGALVTFVRDGRYKLIHTLRGVEVATDLMSPRTAIDPRYLARVAGVLGGAPERRERWALFDLTEDPGERRNLAGERPEIFAAMRARLGAWQAAAPPGRSPHAPSEDDLPEETLKELRALGYVD